MWIQNIIAKALQCFPSECGPSLYGDVSTFQGKHEMPWPDEHGYTFS